VWPQSGYNQDREDQKYQTTPAMAAKKIATPITIPKFTFVVRLCTFTSGRPELSFSIDMMGAHHGPRSGQLVPHLAQ
jgi:hypothetical protein